MPKFFPCSCHCRCSGPGAPPPPPNHPRQSYNGQPAPKRRPRRERKPPQPAAHSCHVPAGHFPTAAAAQPGYRQSLPASGCWQPRPVCSQMPAPSCCHASAPPPPAGDGRRKASATSVGHPKKRGRTPDARTVTRPPLHPSPMRHSKKARTVGTWCAPATTGLLTYFSSKPWPEQQCCGVIGSESAKLFGAWKAQLPGCGVCPPAPTEDVMGRPEIPPSDLPDPLLPPPPLLHEDVLLALSPEEEMEVAAMVEVASANPPNAV